MPFVSRQDPRALVAKAPYTPGRLRSAAKLPIDRTDNPNEYFVKSRSRKDHWWPVNLMGDPMCYCEDSEHTTRQCAHVIAARLARGDMTLVAALNEQLERALANLKQHTRTRRTRGGRE